MHLTTLVVASIALPGLAAAETADETSNSLTATATLTFASRYVSDGVELSDGPVFQPYLELGHGGFYAGVWATNGSEDLLGANSEIDLYVGYRGEAGVVYYDVGYGYYIYPGASALNSGEVLVSAGAGLRETLFLTAAFGYASELDALDSSLTVDYGTPLEGLSLAATYGDISNDGGKYWSIGADYAFNDTVSANLTWEDNDSNDGIAVFAISSTFSLR
jgi:uncharacterized protein (TIGR02001 family)